MTIKGSTNIILLILLLAGTSCTSSESRDRQIRSSIERQLAQYPLMGYQDLYKSFFQDVYGPGHLISDTAQAARYLQSELDAMQQNNIPLYEPTGYKNNFYRVSLSVIRNGQVPYPLFFDAFIRSVSDIQPMPIEKWREEWRRIDSVIASMQLSLPNYEAERQNIMNLLSEGDYVMHHSEQFSDKYNPHYRIIKREIFEQEILPFLQNDK